VIPMEIQLQNAGKKFNQKWIFRGLSLDIPRGARTAITGKNGSGKSTLLLMLAGYLSPTEGMVSWQNGEQSIDNGKQFIDPEEVFRFIGLAAPSMELIEEFTLAEVIRFQEKFKPFLPGFREHDLLEISLLADHASKPIRQYSSGMRQRTKLLLAIMGNAPLLLLDEPCSHLDREGIAWYHDLLRDYGKGRTMVIASNHREEEYPGCEHFIRLPA
jgi:ABC-type multidrug transport system ATPase subunit